MNEVQLRINDKNGTFYIEIDGKEQAIMTFVFTNDNKISIDHTEVYAGNEGKGLAKKLVNKAVDYAREHNLKIIPVCTFVKSVIDKTPEFKDIV